MNFGMETDHNLPTNSALHCTSQQL